MEYTCRAKQKAAISRFIKMVMAKPGKRYPVYVWKIPAIFPEYMYAMFEGWRNKSPYQEVELFKSDAEFFDALYKRFDAFGLNWHIKTSYGREKIYFGI